MCEGARSMAKLDDHMRYRTLGDEDNLARRPSRKTRIEETVQIVLLPGLGADRRLFAALDGTVPDVVVPVWPQPRRAESLEEFAARWAANAPWPSPVVVGGSSFGGMVALELARHVRAKALALIGSCAHPSELAQPLRLLRRFAGRVPMPPLPTRGPAARALAWYFGADSTSASRLFLDMLRDADPEFVAWAIRAIGSWSPRQLPSIPIWRIHGRRDRLISCPSGAAVVVQSAGHLLPITHGDELAAFIRKVAASVHDAP
jgi:pimeloyl-ACP methyl ester carboxylesterase